jgi:1-acyl-sn-glycerol-3-phosphate acyltransferase
MKLVLKSDVPVIPCGITGTYDVCPRWDDMKWHKVVLGRETVTIRYGKPILFGRHDCRATRELARPVATQRIEEALLFLTA